LNKERNLDFIDDDIILHDIVDIHSDMNISLEAPCRWLPESTNAENEIRTIFFLHWEKLKDHFIATVNEINAWRQKVIEDTQKYTDEQIRILAEDYKRQRLYIDQKREENLDTTRAYADANNNELFDELRKECRLLEFQMAQLENINGTMNARRVVTVQEQMERKKMEKSAASKPVNNTPEEKPIPEHTNTIQDNRNESGNGPVELTSPSPNETQ
jgi:hypothetical protein